MITKTLKAGVSKRMISDSSFNTIIEGKARVNLNHKVFYNPAQQFNRDLSILVINTFAKQLREETKKEGITILEALSATGLRSIRYWKEIEGIESIIVNDIDPDAVEAIRKNIEDNGIDTTKCIPNRGDCTSVMYEHRDKKFDVVDIDPFGSASMFMDAAVQSVSNGGLLCITCTDLPVLCGNYPETCYAKYQSVSIKGKYCHESSLRIVLASIQAHAARYKRYIEPIVSIYVDFYVRIFVRVYDSPGEVKNAFTKVGMLYQCDGCHSFWTKPLGTTEGKKYKISKSSTIPNNCDDCKSNIKIGGPIWLDSLHSKDWLKLFLDDLNSKDDKFATHKRLLGLLTLCSEELPDVPLFYIHSQLCKNVRINSPSIKIFKSGLINAGYKVSGSHCSPEALKTNAPNTAIWDMMRCLNKIYPSKIESIDKNAPGAKILREEPTTNFDFTLVEEAIGNKLPKFFSAGGPMSRPNKKQ